MPSSRMISGRGERRFLFRSTRLRPYLAASLKVSLGVVFPLRLSILPTSHTTSPVLRIPAKKSQIFLADLYELAAGNLDFHQEGMRLSQRPFRRIVNIQRKIYVGNNHRLAVR